MSYIEISIISNADFAEIMIAELSEIEFESFTEEPNGLKAYIQEKFFKEENLVEIFERYKEIFDFSYTLKAIEKENWNAEWEKNYPAISIADKIQVRASFHEKLPNIIYDIVINPKMSFGTGHHETTSMVMEHQLEVDHKGKAVLDIGCGTAILAILAHKLGATKLSAFDIEEWAAENSKENAVLNNCENLKIRQGTIDDEPLFSYNILLANINRNILLRDVNQYIKYLEKGGCIIVSGFYIQDQRDIETKFAEFGLKKIAEKNRNNWASLRFELN